VTYDPNLFWMDSELQPSCDAVDGLATGEYLTVWAQNGAGNVCYTVGGTLIDLPAADVLPGKPTGSSAEAAGQTQINFKTEKAMGVFGLEPARVMTKSGEGAWLGGFTKIYAATESAFDPPTPGELPTLLFTRSYAPAAPSMPAAGCADVFVVSLKRAPSPSGRVKPPGG
jgi:hypothetical protein